MALATYTDLQNSVADWLQRDDLTSVIPDFIRLAEASFARRRDIVVERDIPFTIDTSPKALPADCREATDLYYNDPTVTIDGRLPINIVSLPVLALRAGHYSSPGRPVWAAVGANGTSLTFAPAPDQPYNAFLSYVVNLSPLATATGGSNALYTDSPDIYLWGSLAQAEAYLKNDPRIATWKQNLETAIAERNDLIKRRKFSINTPVHRPRRTLE